MKLHIAAARLNQLDHGLPPPPHADPSGAGGGGGRDFDVLAMLFPILGMGWGACSQGAGREDDGGALLTGIATWDSTAL